MICGGSSYKGKSCANTLLVREYAEGTPGRAVTMCAIKDEQSNRSLVRCKFFNIQGIVDSHYPYRYMDSFDRFQEENSPPRSEEADVSGDYAHAQRMWNTFNIQNLGQYHNSYMASDVHLLLDAFENFRSLCLDVWF